MAFVMGVSTIIWVKIYSVNYIRVSISKSLAASTTENSNGEIG
jgi:hypothetical protein